MKIRRRALSGTGQRRLSEELDLLRARAGERAVTLREVIYVLGGRAYLLLVLLLALPFITPIPIPGLSTPFGLAIALIAFTTYTVRQDRDLVTASGAKLQQDLLSLRRGGAMSAYRGVLIRVLDYQHRNSLACSRDRSRNCRR